MIIYRGVALAAGFTSLLGATVTPSATQSHTSQFEMTASASADTFKGDSIELLDIDFEITHGTTDGMAILYAENAYMTNIGSGFIVERQGIWIDDCETNQLIGRAFLRRENPSKMILFQSHSSPKYAVLKPDGDKRKASVSGTAVYSNYGSGNVAITGGALQCSTENSGFMIAGCSSIFPAGATPVKTGTSAWGIVQVSYGSLTSNVSIGTYVATSVTMVAQHTTLYRVGLGGVYSSTRLRKMVIFDSGDGTPSAPVDVSNTLYDVEVGLFGDANALQFVDDFFVMGVSPGKMSVAALPLYTGTGIQYASANITASEEIVLDALHLVTWMDIQWSGFVPELKDQAILKAEGESQFIIPILASSGYILTAHQVQAFILDVTSEWPDVYGISEIAGTRNYKHWKGKVFRWGIKYSI